MKVTPPSVLTSWPEPPPPFNMFITTSDMWPSRVEAQAPDSLGQVPAPGLTGVESCEMRFQLTGALSPHLQNEHKIVLTPRVLGGLPGKPWSRYCSFACLSL